MTSRQQVETEKEFIENVKKKLYNLNLRFESYSHIFPLTIRKCMSFFYKLEYRDDLQHGSAPIWVPKTEINDGDALRIIENDVKILLAGITADGYTSCKQSFQDLRDYINSWFEDIHIQKTEMNEPGNSHDTDGVLQDLTVRVQKLTEVIDNKTDSERRIASMIAQLQDYVQKLSHDHQKEHNEDMALESLSDFEKQELGLQYIQLTMDAFEEFDTKNIDMRKMSEYEYHTFTGLSHLKNKTGLYRHIQAAVQQKDANDACGRWVYILTNYKKDIFFLIKRVEAVLTDEEQKIMRKVKIRIWLFMRLFDIKIEE